VNRKLLVIGCIVVAALVTACGAQNTAPSTAPNSAALPTQSPESSSAPTQAKPTATVAPALPLGDPREAVIKAVRAQLKAGPYRVKSTTTTDKGTSERTAEVILPDRFHITTRSGQTQQEFIIIATKTYRKVGDRWTEIPIDMGSLVGEFVSGLSEEAEKGISDVKLVGPDVVNGTPTLVYTYNVKVKLNDTELNSAVKMWVSVANGLPLKQEVDGEFAGVKSKTVQVIEYDSSIKIEAPIK